MCQGEESASHNPDYLGKGTLRVLNQVDETKNNRQKAFLDF